LIHVDFAAALFVVWGVLTMLIGLSTLALSVAAAALMSGERQLAAGLTAAVLVTFGVVALVWGLAHVVVGVPLRRHRSWSRLAALMLGAIDLVLLPYGTVLGAYSLWALLRDEGRKLFES
jgi:hypothetical protein